jgi:co-chaperonin GroES (HSP10)
VRLDTTEGKSPANERLALDDIRDMPTDLVLVRKSRLWSRTYFSAGSDYATPVVVEVQAHQSRDKPFFGDIVQQGPGVIIHGAGNPMVGARGDIIVTNTNMISYRLTERGAVYYAIRNSAIMALLNPSSFELRPQQHYILVRENEKAALALSSRGPIWVPTMGMETDDEGDRHNEGLRAEYGEVITVGPGRWQDGEFQHTTAKAGDMLLYDCSHSTLAVTIRGARFTLVPSTSVVAVYRGAASGSAA